MKTNDKDQPDSTVRYLQPTVEGDLDQDVQSHQAPKGKEVEGHELSKFSQDRPVKGGNEPGV